MSSLIDTNRVTQIAIVVKDIETSKKKFAEFFGIEPPPHFDSGKYEVTQTVVDGQPAPDAACYMAFFDVGPGLRIELIQPNEAKSTWRDFLDTHGEGIHHIAFNVKGMDAQIKNCEAAGMPCVQRGKYGDGGGEYAYVDATKDLKFILELLENY